MTWAKVDDGLHSHPKARRAGLPALGLHLLAMSYCGCYLTDGFVDDGWLSERLRTKADRGIPARLCEAGLWDKGVGGYQIHDWHLYNPSRSEVEAKRAAQSAAGKAAAKARWGANGHG